MVAVERVFDGVVVAPRVLHIDLVQPPLDLHDVLGVPKDIGRLALEPAGWRAHQDAGIGARAAMVLGARAEQERAHRGRLPDAERRHGAADELHRVVDREARRHHPARRVDVEGDLLLGVLGLQEQELRDDQRRGEILDRSGQEDDALAQEPRVDVESPLAAVRLLDHHGHEGTVIVVDWISHLSLCS